MADKHDGFWSSILNDLKKHGDGAIAPYISDWGLKYGGIYANKLGLCEVLKLFKREHLEMIAKFTPGIGGYLSERLPPEILGSTFLSQLTGHIMTQFSHSIAHVLRKHGGDFTRVSDKEIGEALEGATQKVLTEMNYGMTKEGVIHALKPSKCIQVIRIFGDDLKSLRELSAGDVIALFAQGAQGCDCCFGSIKRTIEVPAEAVPAAKAEPKPADPKSGAEMFWLMTAEDRKTIFDFPPTIQDTAQKKRCEALIQEHLNLSEAPFLAWAIRERPAQIDFALALCENASVSYRAAKELKRAEGWIERQSDKLNAALAPVNDRLEHRAIVNGNPASTLDAVLGARRRSKPTFWQSLLRL